MHGIRLPEFYFVALKEAQTELIQMYTGITQSVDVLPYEDSAGLPIANIFAPLLMEEDLKAKERVPNPDSAGGKELNSLREMFYTAHKPVKRIFMKGEAGCGKTFFCLKLLNTWCQVKHSKIVSDDVLQQCLAVFDLVFYLPLRHFKEHLKSVKDMIGQTVSQQCLRLLTSLGQRIHCLVILDGLDESPVMFKELPSMHGIDSCVLFCTTRPWKLTQLPLKFRPDDKVVQIMGLLPSSEKKVVEYVLVNFYKLKSKTPEFEQKFNRYSAMLKESSLESLVKIPMMLTACCCMWYEEDVFSEQSKGRKVQVTKDSPTVHTSMTYTYLSLVDSMIRRADEKCDLKSVLMQSLPSPPTNIPKILASFSYINSFLGALLPLCRLAYTDLVSGDTKLVFQKDELEREIGRPLVEIALKVGLISQTKAPGRFHQQNVSVNFYHKSVQEFLAAVHLTCTDTHDIRSYCTSLDKVMDVANIIKFGIALDPSFCHDVSKHVMETLNAGADILQYRRTLYDDSTGWVRVSQLYRTQCEWYRELTHVQTVTGDTSPPHSLHVTDIYLYGSDSEDTVRLTEELMSVNLGRIVSVTLWGVQHPLHRVVSYLPQCRQLSALYIGNMDNKENRDLLVPVIPCLTQLTTVRYEGSLSDADSDEYDGDDAVVAAVMSLTQLDSGRYEGCFEGTYMADGWRSDRAVVAAIMSLTQLVSVWLEDVSLDDDGLEGTDAMTRLRTVVLGDGVLGGGVRMTAGAWDRFVTSLLSLPQSVSVVLRGTDIDRRTLRRIRTSKRVTVTRDDRREEEESDEEGTYMYERLDFTTVPSQTDQ